MSNSNIEFKVKLRWWWPILFPVWVAQRLICGKGKVDAWLPKGVIYLERVK